MATRLQPRHFRQLTGRALRKAGALLEAPPTEDGGEAAPEPEPERAFDPAVDLRLGGYPRAESVFRRMHRYHELTEYDSRLSELIDYFGWDTGSKGHACRRWFFHDDPKFWKYLEKMGLEEPEYSVMHQYTNFHRYDWERHDLFWIYDELLERLEALGGKDELSVLDFGCGLGQAGLAFALDGYRVVSADKTPAVLDFCRFLFANRGLEPEIYQATDDHDYYDTGADGRPFGLVIEWSVFEHIYDQIPALERITGGLVSGGVYLTTTHAKDWTPELREHYIRDSGDEGISEQLFGDELDRWIHDRFEVVTRPRTIAKLLVKK